MADPNADPLAELSSKSDDELASLESELVAQFDAADEADDLDAMSAAADQIDAVRAEIERRGTGGKETPVEDQTKDTEKEEEAVTASADAPEQPEGGEAETAPEQPAEETGADEPGEVDPPAEGSEPAETAITEDAAPEGDAPEDGAAPDADNPTTQPEATTAGGDNKEDSVDIPEDRKPVVASAANEIVAGTDIPSIAAGTKFEDRMQIAQAMERRLDSVRSSRTPGEQNHTVATIIASAPAERTLDPNDIPGNLAKIEDITRVEAITAAGGYCAPLETRYDIFGTGVTDRPVRDALAGFQARRGGIRYTAAPKITDFAGASGLWTAENDANPGATIDPDGTPATGDEYTLLSEKPCYTVECQPEVTAMVDAVTLCLQFGNLMTRAYPELIDRNNQLALVAHARYAERNLLNKLTALSTSVTSSFKLGTVRDFLFAVGRGAAAYRHRYRMTPRQPLRVLAPVWVKDAMREDLAWQMPGNGDSLAAADSVIESYFRARNVNVSWHLDAPGFADEVDASTLDDFPGSFDWYLYAEGAFLFLDGGTLDLGIVRDASLVSTNDYKTFTESFEGVARIGAESVRVTTTTKVAGATAGTVDTIA